jgi:UrcA family protein
MTANKWIAALAVATALAIAPLPSSAASDGVPKRIVKVWDLDLSKPADVRTLYQRLQAAANQICRTQVKREWMAKRQRVPNRWTERCVRDAVDAAVRDTANQPLAQLHASAGRAAARTL